jgi:hypothetical protein
MPCPTFFFSFRNFLQVLGPLIQACISLIRLYIKSRTWINSLPWSWGWIGIFFMGFEKNYYYQLLVENGEKYPPWILVKKDINVVLHWEGWHVKWNEVGWITLYVPLVPLWSHIRKRNTHMEVKIKYQVKRNSYYEKQLKASEELPKLVKDVLWGRKSISSHFLRDQNNNSCGFWRFFSCLNGRIWSGAWISHFLAIFLATCWNLS